MLHRQISEGFSSYAYHVLHLVTGCVDFLSLICAWAFDVSHISTRQKCFLSNCFFIIYHCLTDLPEINHGALVRVVTFQGILDKQELTIGGRLRTVRVSQTCLKNYDPFLTPLFENAAIQQVNFSVIFWFVHWRRQWFTAFLLIGLH